MPIFKKIICATALVMFFQGCGSSAKNEDSAAKTPHERNALEEYVRAPIDSANAVKAKSAERDAEMAEQMAPGDE